MTDPFEKVFGQQGKEAGRELAIATCYELAMEEIYGPRGIASRLNRPFVTSWKTAVDQEEFNVGSPIVIETTEGPLQLIFASPAYGPAAKERKLFIKSCEPDVKTLGYNLGEFIIEKKRYWQTTGVWFCRDCKHKLYHRL